MKRGRIVWGASFAYLVYLFLGEAPWLSANPLFSVQAAFVLLVALYLASSFALWGARRAGLFLVATWLVSYCVEYVGVKTGFPFGHYVYTTHMGPLLGPVPVFIPLIWCSLGYFCLQACGPSIVAPSMLMMVLDVSFDPIFAGSLWIWHPTAGPAYYGVPVLNFVGWLLTSVLIFSAFSLLTQRGRARPLASLIYSGGSREGVLFYLVFGLSTVLFLVSQSLPGAAVVSAVLYGGTVAWLWRTPRAGGPGTADP